MSRSASGSRQRRNGRLGSWRAEPWSHGGSGFQLYEAAKAGQVETVRDLLAGGVTTTEHTDKVRPPFRKGPHRRVSFSARPT